ncbi:MAG TPA: hypothetical protein PLO33_01890 [Kouleothrix sp.]|uniref:hypothetical protein n=1 Tax=Kouleothrix sp. TaxID=2779161 RepID=UPI002B5548F9|nr:hypothetical protein [Kouleothrix sp.]HRC74395.1 hypothetical protein [Kouleothrix sp.]
MFHSRIPILRIAIALGLLVLLSATAYGFAASNTVPENGAGDGQATISGYAVTNVTYTLNATTPTNLDKVEFDVAPSAGADPPTTVRVKLISSGSTWYSCTAPTTGTTWSCATTSPSVTASAVNQLQVVAAQ